MKNGYICAITTLSKDRKFSEVEKKYMKNVYFYLPKAKARYEHIQQLNTKLSKAEVKVIAGLTYRFSHEDLEKLFEDIDPNDKKHIYAGIG